MAIHRQVIWDVIFFGGVSTRPGGTGIGFPSSVFSFRFKRSISSFFFVFSMPRSESALSTELPCIGLSSGWDFSMREGCLPQTGFVLERVRVDLIQYGQWRPDIGHHHLTAEIAGRQQQVAGLLAENVIVSAIGTAPITSPVSPITPLGMSIAMIVAVPAAAAASVSRTKPLRGRLSPAPNNASTISSAPSSTGMSSAST
jgi:hypothetical protein